MFSVVDQSSLDVNVGDYVMAASVTGETLDLLLPAGSAYVPGESEVWILGTVAEANNAQAIVSIGNASVDYSVLLSDSPNMSLAIGDVVEVSGIRPAAEGPVLMGIHGSGR